MSLFNFGTVCILLGPTSQQQNMVTSTRHTAIPKPLRKHLAPNKPQCLGPNNLCVLFQCLLLSMWRNTNCYNAIPVSHFAFGAKIDNGKLSETGPPKERTP
eukprot:1367375-Amphidinium_carterae.1